MGDVEVGAALRACRKRMGWSRETLAHHSSVSWSAIAQIESGRRKDIRLGTLAALATALGVSVDYLIAGRSVATPAMLGHRILQYGSDGEFLAAATEFLAQGIRRSERVLAVASGGKIAQLRDALGSDADRMRFADAPDWYRTPRSAARKYRDFLAESDEHSWVRIIGEPVWEGCSPSEVRAWTRYESLINLTFAAVPATIVCAYDTRSTPSEVLRDALCTHPTQHANGAAVESPSYRHPEDLLLEIE